MKIGEGNEQFLACSFHVFIVIISLMSNLVCFLVEAFMFSVLLKLLWLLARSNYKVMHWNKFYCFCFWCSCFVESICSFTEVGWIIPLCEGCKYEIVLVTVLFHLSCLINFGLGIFLALEEAVKEGILYWVSSNSLWHSARHIASRV